MCPTTNVVIHRRAIRVEQNDAMIKPRGSLFGLIWLKIKKKQNYGYIAPKIQNFKLSKTLKSSIICEVLLKITQSVAKFRTFKNTFVNAYKKLT